MTQHEIPARFIVDPKRYLHIPLGDGFLFSGKFSQWYWRQRPRPNLTCIDNRMYIETDDPIVEMSFRHL